MRIIITGGGTGGHVFPAISIAEEIKRRNKSNKILFVGSRRGIEKNLVPKNGYEIKYINSMGISRVGIARGALGAFAAFRGLLESAFLIRSFKPDVVLGVGGYASGPSVLAAALLGVATAICEQNTVPGATNRILSKFVNRIFASFEESIRYFPPKKVVITGNPIRGELLLSMGDSSATLLTTSPSPIGKRSGLGSKGFSILVLGGSQGARRLNLAVPKAIGELGRGDISVLHQTGKDGGAVALDYKKYNVKARTLAFIDDMANAYAKSDLVIGRAGAGTIAEITALGKPSILVPFPHAAGDHQTENARVLREAGASVTLTDEVATPENLAKTLRELLDKDKLAEMARAASTLGVPEAAKRIVDGIYELMDKSAGVR